MVKVTCPICGQPMQGQRAEEWPQFPFCSQRCRLIDLGRWLGERYRFDASPEEEQMPDNGDSDDP